MADLGVPGSLLILEIGVKRGDFDIVPIRLSGLKRGDRAIVPPFGFIILVIT